ncbi:MAG: methyltransferase [Thermodesulfobacteriota bacterium]
MYGQVKLLPFKDLVIAFDQPRMLLTEQAPEYVMGIGSSTLTLANLTIRRPVQKALDLGTGCGIQALLAGKHSEQVWATDQNPRAVRLAEFNARLNGMDHINCRQGDLFEPVRNEHFDLIVTNPPFVISPENRYIYRDSGMVGDELVRKIARQASDYLSDGGFCHILCNWAEKADQDWKERLRSWFEDTCDVWVIRSETRDADTYASTWIRHTEKKAVDDFARRFEEWTDYYERQSIRSIGAGMITLRKSSERSAWFRAEDGPERMMGPCGEDIATGFAIQDYLESISQEIDLMQAVLQVSPKTRLDRESIPTDQGWMDQSFRLHLSEGLAYSANADPVVANLLVKCNGRTPLNTLVHQAADALNEPVEKLTSPLCGIVRSLIAQGFLMPIHLAQKNASAGSSDGRTRDTTTS